MNRNSLYMVIGVLGITVVAIGSQFYHERQKPTGVEISIGDHGISVDKKCPTNDKCVIDFAAVVNADAML